MQQSPTETGENVVHIRKYANRRLYDTESSAFVTLSNLADMVKAGREFVVEDANTGSDLTSSVLIHIIAEEEAKGEHLLPLGYLRRLIRFYGEDMGQYVSTYLDQTLQAFASNQQQFVEQMQEMFTAESPMQAIARQNMALFNSTMDSFTSLSGLSQGAPPRGRKASTEAPSVATESEDGTVKNAQEVSELKAALDALRRRVDELES